MNLPGAIDGILSINFETNDTVEKLINALAKLQTSSKLENLENKYMVILDDNQEVCPREDQVTKHLSEAKTITFDYKDHVVLQFTTLETKVEDGKDILTPVFKFKFVPYEVACKEKVKLKKTVNDYICEDDVVS